MFLNDNLNICMCQCRMYRVVSFVDTAEVGLVSDGWWEADTDATPAKKPFGHVYWPPSKSDEARDRLMRNHQAPDLDTWSKYRAQSVYVTGE